MSNLNVLTVSIKPLKVLMAALLAVVVMACGGGGGGLDTSGANLTVLLVNEGSGIDDRSFNAAAWRGITSFFGDTPENTTYRGRFYNDLFSSTADERMPNVRLASEQGVDLIIATGFTFAEPVYVVSADFPNQRYLIIDSFVDRANVASALFAEHEGSFLVGAAAALKAIEDGIVNPSFGFIGGMAGPVITRFQVGFVQGVRSVLPNAEIHEFYANAWGAPQLAMTQAQQWYNSGVYAIFTAAGGTGMGAIVQAREARVAGQNVWVLGVDSDQHEDGIYNNAGNSAVLTSMIKKVETPVLYTLNRLRHTEFQGGLTVYDLAMDGVDIARSNPALGPAILAQIDTMRAQIIGGQIQVISTVAQAQALGLLGANTAARD
ncbi:MAG: BMP family ABC transporter substrate-binding protein [Spirochaetaceae bacterium]|nr:BMP family ABC transporter substrate-binding protein [Spirochaetaceae bacterium]